MKSFIFLMAVLFSLNSIAEAPNETKTNQQYEPAKIWLGWPAGTFFGFGLGHGLQDRYVKDYGWVYTVTESAGMLLILSTMGDCFPRESCSSYKDNAIRNGSIIYFGSRIIEVIDLTLWSYKYYNQNQASVYMIPKKDGVSLTASLSF